MPLTLKERWTIGQIQVHRDLVVSNEVDPQSTPNPDTSLSLLASKSSFVKTRHSTGSPHSDFSGI